MKFLRDLPVVLPSKAKKETQISFNLVLRTTTLRSLTTLIILLLLLMLTLKSILNLKRHPKTRRGPKISIKKKIFKSVKLK